MPRTREPVREPLSQLKKLELDYADTPMAPRLLMLKMLKESQKRPMSEVAAELGVSQRNVMRWWKTYRTEGVDALLRYRPSGGRRPRRLDDEALAALQEKLETEGIGTIEEARAWLDERFGVRYSRSGVWYLMRNSIGAIPRGWVTFHDDMAATTPNPTPQPTTPTGSIPEHILQFLNGLPICGGRKEMILQIRQSLLLLFPEIDHITFAVNFACDLAAPETYQPKSGISQYPNTAYVSADSNSDSDPIARILSSLRQQGHQFDQYHEPLGFAYYHADIAYLGVVIIWKSADSSPISEGVSIMMSQLQPFLKYMLANVVAHDRLSRPIGAVFTSAIAEMVRDAGLSSQEERVVLLQLLGHSYREIADRLYVTVDTVKKHFKQIYRKTKTKSQSELFAKYFTTRISMPQDHDPDDE